MTKCYMTNGIPPATFGNDDDTAIDAGLLYLKEDGSWSYQCDLRGPNIQSEFDRRLSHAIEFLAVHSDVTVDAWTLDYLSKRAAAPAQPA